MKRKRRADYRQLAWAWGLLLALFGLVSPGFAQSDELEISIPVEQIGLKGELRVGEWVPLQVTLRNRSKVHLKDIRCEWVLEDVDGDTVAMQRRVSVGAQGERRVWLYAAVPFRPSLQGVRWRIRVVDHESGQLLESVEVVPPKAIAINSTGGWLSRMVGIVGRSVVGLDNYRSAETQHEPTRLITGLDPVSLPDRWYGLAMLESLVWLPGGGDPSDRGVPAEAIRNWVRRGGHLVIVLRGTGAGNTLAVWQNSPLASLLPSVKPADVAMLNSMSMDRPLPPWLGVPRERAWVVAQPLEPRTESEASVVLRSGDMPLVVAKSYGVGRVTVIGLDLSDALLADQELPNGEALWKAIYGWQGEVIPEQIFRRSVEKGDFAGVDQRIVQYLGSDYVSERVAMLGAVAGPLVGAIFLFLIYGLAAPLVHGVLRSRKATHLSWVAFLILVLAFAALAWTGAYLTRPVATKIAHFSVLTVNVADRVAHTRSWLSLFEPEYGRVVMAVDPAAGELNRHTLASVAPGIRGESGGFPDPQSYEMEAGAPWQLAPPMRSTARQLELDYLGQRGDAGGVADAWTRVEGEVTLEEGRLRGSLTHHLPGDLSDVLVVYSPGGDVLRPDPVTNALPVRVWRLFTDARGRSWQWGSGETIDLSNLLSPGDSEPLLKEPRLWRQGGENSKERKWGGFLGDLEMPRTTSGPGQGLPVSSATSVEHLWQLSFFSALPPPEYRRPEGVFGFAGDSYNLNRILGRRMDLTKHLAEHRLIILGLIRQSSPLPAPLTVDGEPVERSDTSSQTLVRLILPVRKVAPSPPASGG